LLRLLRQELRDDAGTARRRAFGDEASVAVDLFDQVWWSTRLASTNANRLELR
jgi:hypothetical protein